MVVDVYLRCARQGWDGFSIDWPDGRGLIYQPVKLIAAFDTLRAFFDEWKGKKDAQADRQDA